MNHLYLFKRTFIMLLLFTLISSQEADEGREETAAPSHAAGVRKPSNMKNPGMLRDFYFTNLDIRTAFKAVGTAGKVDIVLSPKVTGRVNLTLTSKTWKQAMKVLCQMFNLQYIFENNYIYVQSIKEFNASEQEARLERRIIHLKHTKVSDLKSAVEGLLSKRGKLSVVEKSNALIINDLPMKIKEIQQAIGALDIETFQVHIQAQIIEASSDALQELGINWGYGVGNPAPDVSTIPGAQSGAVLGQSSPGRVLNPSLSLAFRLLDGSLAAAIENLLTEGKGEVVAKPQITTLDNTEARIFIGEKRPFNKLDANLNSTTEFIDAGVELIVTPHLTNNKRIILDLAPQRSEARTDAITRGPIVTTTEARTTVVVDDGETVVIGGLTSKVENETETGVPFLKDIPLLGFLFRHTYKKVEKKDLIIFITPFIVKKDTESRAEAAPGQEE